MRAKLLGIKLTDEEMEQFKATALAVTGRRNVSNWARSALKQLVEDSSPAAPSPARNGSTGRAAASPAEGDPSGIPMPEPLLWADLWAEMERMEQGEAADRFRELAAGRKLPDGFRGWARAVKIAWLEREWGISCD